MQIFSAKAYELGIEAAEDLNYRLVYNQGFCFEGIKQCHGLWGVFPGEVLNIAAVWVVEGKLAQEIVIIL